MEFLKRFPGSSTSKLVRFRHVSSYLLPNRTGNFHCIRLSKLYDFPIPGLLHHSSATCYSGLSLALDSFALSWALPQAFDYFESSVSMSLSACRRSRSSFRTVLIRRLPFAVHHSSWVGCGRDGEYHGWNMMLIPHMSNSTMKTW